MVKSFDGTVWLGNAPPTHCEIHILSLQHFFRMMYLNTNLQIDDDDDDDDIHEKYICFCVFMLLFANFERLSGVPYA